MVDRIKAIQERVKHRHGSPRITEALARAGSPAGHNRVVRLMREHDLYSLKEIEWAIKPKMQAGWSWRR